MNPLIRNTIGNIVERLFVVGSSFLQLSVYARSLGLDSYGLIGAIAGLSALIGFVNLSLESNLLRKRLRGNANGFLVHLNVYYGFWQIKAVVLSAIYISLPFWFGADYKRDLDLYCVSLSALTLVLLDSWLAPTSIYLSASLKHHVVAKFAFVRALLGAILLLPLVFIPSLVVMLLKDIVLAVFVVLFWQRTIVKEIGAKAIYTLMPFSSRNFTLALAIIRRYVGWVHLNSSITNVVYRADLYFLAMFHPLGDVGKYNIALGLAGLVNVLTMILGYQNTLAIANANQQDKPRVALNFLIASCLIGVIMALFFYFTADLLIWLVSGVKDPEISKVLLLLVLALLVVKSFASPFVSMVLTSGDVKRYALRVSVPLFVVAATCYYGAAKWGTLLTLSQANVVVALVWLALVIYEAQRSGVLKKFLGQHR